MKVWIMEISVKLLPFIILILLILTVCTTLFLTLREQHIANGLPYISDTGTLPPESCIFGQALNLLWILFSFAIYVKYRQAEHLFNRYSIQRCITLNKAALYVGLLATFGCSLVGNFQETTCIFVHWIGAVLVFGLGAIYQCIQTMLYMSLLSLNLLLEQRKRTKLRIGLSAVSVITFFIFFVCAIASYIEKDDYDYLHWKPEESGYYLHNISAATEWICAACTTTYVTLFYWEFSKISVHKPDVFVEDEAINIEHIQQTTGTLQDK